MDAFKKFPHKFTNFAIRAYCLVHKLTMQRHHPQHNDYF